MKSFEERLARLETLSDTLKGGKIPLEEAVAVFEEGMKLARELEKELGRIERKVEILVNEPEKKKGSTVEPDLQLFPELDEESRE